MGYLISEACASIHDEGPGPTAPGHRGDEQPILLALLEELLQGHDVHTLMAALIHGLVRRLIVDCDPLPNSRTEAALSLGAAAAGMVVAAWSPALPNALWPNRSINFVQQRHALEYLLCMLSLHHAIGLQTDCMMDVLVPVIEAARLPFVCPMDLGYRFPAL